jgi:release factor glutamine methyltransferase
MVIKLTEVELARVVDTLRAAGCVFAEDEAEVLCSGAEDAAHLAAMVARRAAGEPLELVLGWAEFRGLRIEVEPGVFVPRRRTAYLAELAEGFLAPGDVVVDLCCGAGAIGASLLDAMRGRGGGEIELHAADVSDVAVHCARKNLAAAIDRGAAFVYQGDLDAPLPARIAGRVSVLTANVPYVPSAEITLLPAEARDYEPLSALDGGSDGLDILRRVAEAAPRWLRPEGRVLIEISDRQQDPAIAAFRAAGLEPSVRESDDYYTTVLVGRFAHGSPERAARPAPASVTRAVGPRG